MSTYKPGDVALIDSWRGQRQLAFRVYRSGAGADWCVLDGTDTRGLEDDEVRSSYPVVVIDPDDPEQVKRLVRCFWDANTDGGDDDATYMAAALREFASPTPPKCVAHGEPACDQCSRISTDYLRDGECRDCGTWGDTGMHWDTCPGRIRGVVYANRDEATA